MAIVPRQLVDLAFTSPYPRFVLAQVSYMRNTALKEKGDGYLATVNRTLREVAVPASFIPVSPFLVSLVEHVLRIVGHSSTHEHVRRHSVEF